MSPTRQMRILAVIFLVIFAFTVSGCETVNRKFTRKKQKEVGPPQIYHVEPFVPPPAAEIYQHAFLFWKTWEDEIVISLTTAGFPKTINSHRVRSCLEDAISNLIEMKGCLNEKKATELDVYIKELQHYLDIVKTGSISDNTLARMKDDIAAHKRNVEIRFSYSEIKNDIKDDSSRPESN